MEDAVHIRRQEYWAHDIVHGLRHPKDGLSNNNKKTDDDFRQVVVAFWNIEPGELEDYQEIPMHQVVGYGAFAHGGDVDPAAEKTKRLSCGEEADCGKAKNDT